MPAFYGVNSTKRRATPPNFIGGGDQGGIIRQTYDEIATTTAMTTADTIMLGQLPVGARVVGIEVAWVAHATGRTIKIGDSVDDDRFYTATSIATAGSSNALALAGVGYRNTTGAPVDIIGTLAGGTLAANDKGLVVSLKYVTD